MLRVSELHWWERRHPQCCTTFSSIAGAQHQLHEEKEGRSNSAASMSGFLSPTATSSGRRLKRLDKTASLVGLTYVSSLIVDGLEGE